MESADQLAAIVEYSGDAIFSKTLDGVILTWNAAAEKLYGYTAEEIVGRSVALLVPADRPGEIDGILARLRAGEAVDHFESMRVRKDGSLVPVSLTISPIYGVGGDLVATSTIGRDITERKRNEVALARLAAIVESSDDAIYSKTLDGEILTWNSAAEKLYGYSAEEIIGKSVSVLVPADRGGELESILARLSEGEITDHFESVRVRKDGSAVEVSITISPVRDASGHIAAASTTTRDISGRKRTEALVRSHDQAQEASRAKSEFLATMSHEIRTPLNGVIGLTGLLLDTELTVTQRHYAKGARSSGEALLGIVNDILDFSKIEAGKLQLEATDFDLVEAIEEVAGLVAESARAKGLELVAYCSPEVPNALRGDVGRLRQILLNFATNAVKFTKAGEVVLRACLAEAPTPDQVVVRIEVADTGIGVDQDTAERLFEPFSQADASTARRFGGTGLGLSICRRLAEAMGGSVGLESEPGEGSTFWLCLPLGHAVTPMGEPVSTSRPLEGRRVLVVDQNYSTRTMLASQMAAWGITADIAADSEEATECLHQAAAEGRPYDLALVDMAMPGMDGPEPAGVLRAVFTSLPVLALSSEPVEEVHAAGAGFVASLTKPIRISELHDTLQRVLARQPATTDGHSPSPAVTAHDRGRLLVVDDNAINQEVARGLLARVGYSCDVAYDGVEALAAMERQSYDAVLMDCRMPVMDGFQATGEIRRRESGRSHVPIIAMTAGALVETREECIAAGMDDYITKPVKVAELEAVLTRWISPDHRGVSDQPTADSARGAVLDAEQFDVLRQLAAVSGDPEFLANFVDRYLVQATAELAEMRQAAELPDAIALMELAHGLKGTSATMGASGVASHALRWRNRQRKAGRSQPRCWTRSPSSSSSPPPRSGRRRLQRPRPRLALSLMSVLRQRGALPPVG